MRVEYIDFFIKFFCLFGFLFLAVLFELISLYFESRNYSFSLIKLTILVFSVLMALHEFGGILITTMELSGEEVPSFIEGLSGLFEMTASLFFLIVLLAGDSMKKLKIGKPF